MTYRSRKTTQVYSVTGSRVLLADTETHAENTSGGPVCLHIQCVCVCETLIMHMNKIHECY